MRILHTEDLNLASYFGRGAGSSRSIVLVRCDERRPGRSAGSPQLFMISKQAGKVETYTAHFVVLMSRGALGLVISGRGSMASPITVIFWKGRRSCDTLCSSQRQQCGLGCMRFKPQISETWALRQGCCVLRWRFISRIFAWLFWYTGYHELAEGYVENVRGLAFLGAVQDHLMEVDVL